MTDSVPVGLLEKWINEMQSILKQESQDTETKTDLRINQGMLHGLDQIQLRITTWLSHQENSEALSRSGAKFLITNDVNLSNGRYRKLEWYEGDLFLSLAWRHAKDAETGELMLGMQEVQDLSKTYLVYEGGLSFGDLAGLARAGGLDAIRSDENQGEWVEKT